MREASSSLLVLSLALLAATPAPGATVVERHIHVTLKTDGTVAEVSHLRVRIDHEDDAAAWSTYQVPLYDNRTLERLDVRVALPGGGSAVLEPEDQETVDGSGSGLFYTTLRLHRARLPHLAPGAVITIDQEVIQRPYYPTGRVLVRGGAAVADLRIVVDSGGGPLPDGWHWYLEGSRQGLEIEEKDDGVVVTAKDLPAVDVPELAPVGFQPVLRYGWATSGSWEDVGRWYRELMASVPRADEAVTSEARRIAKETEDPRRRLDALVRFLQDKVRNVAVLIGEGNYRPSPPADVLARKWGDCKDKALLLVDMLRSVGVDAYPTLVQKNAKRKIDPSFPTPDQFNHAIVAVPRDAVAVSEDDPVSGGYLFIDPTQTWGAGRWLDPDAQDQDVLVVSPEAAELVRTPLRPDLEHRRLEADLTVDDEGDARGRARLTIRGELAYEILQGLADRAPEQAAEEVRSIFARLLPGTELGEVAWTTATEAVPSIDLEASVVVPGLVQTGEGGRSFRLPGMQATPDPRLLRDRVVPMALPARSAWMTWRLTLPEGGCLPAGDGEEISNEAGTFRQTVSAEEAGRITLERRVELAERFIPSQLLPALRNLALVEHRAHRRRTRLVCGEGVPQSISAPPGLHSTSTLIVV